MLGYVGVAGLGLNLMGPMSEFGAALSMATVDNTDTLFQDGFEASQDPAAELLPRQTKVIPAEISVPEGMAADYKWLPLENPRSFRIVKFTLREKAVDLKVPRTHTPGAHYHIIDLDVPRQEFDSEISIVNLDDKPVYDAISYTWLAFRRCIPLVINNGQILPVNASLYACLQRLLSLRKEVVLWWDQICVDQTSESEKSAQVKLMSAIFSGARETLIWLGEGDEDSQTALKTLRKICPLQIVDERHEEPLSVLQANAQGLLKDGLREPKSEPYLNRRAVGRLLNRPWFGRAWIYQEAAVSSVAKVMIGKDLIDFSRLSLAVRVYCEAEQEKVRRFQQSLTTATKGYSTLQVIEIGRKQRSSHTQWTDSAFLALLCRLAGTVKATDQRDMIYAFNAFQDPNKPLIASDYFLSLHEVYNRSARALIESTRSLDIFGITGGKERLTGLASWAPDWTQHLPQGHPLCKAGHASGFNACRSRPASVSIGDDSQSIRLQGRIVDTVAVVVDRDFDADDRNKGPIDTFLKLKERHGVLLAAGSPYAAESDGTDPPTINSDPKNAPDQSPKRLLGVMLADGAFTLKTNLPAAHVTVEQRPSALTEQDLTDCFQVFQHEASLRSNNRRIGNFEKLAALRQTMRENMLICVRKHVFCGKTGRLGLAPAGIAKGDVVAVLHGSRCPVVLREVGSGGLRGRRWRLVGQCYFEDWMDGELVDWEENNADVFELV